MKFIDLVKHRKSIRSYSSEPVEHDKVLYALECARLSPSWQNRQCWRFIIIDDPEIKSGAIKATGFNTNKMWIKDAPILVIGLGKPSESGTMNGMEYYLVDFGIAMEHFILGAAEVGLGTCWLGWFNEKRLKKFLKVPDNFKIIALSPLGYPSDKKSFMDVVSKKIARSNKRKDLEKITFKNYFGNAF